jgi:hypothetical protein
VPTKTQNRPFRLDTELWQLVQEGASVTRLTPREFTRQAIRRGAPAVIRALASSDLSPLSAAEWNRVNAVSQEEAAEINRLAAKSVVPDKEWLDR